MRPLQQSTICPDDEDDIKGDAIERMIDRADYLRDERRDREMEEREAARDRKEVAP